MSFLQVENCRVLDVHEKPLKIKDLWMVRNLPAENIWNFSMLNSTFLTSGDEAERESSHCRNHIWKNSCHESATPPKRRHRMTSWTSSFSLDVKRIQLKVECTGQRYEKNGLQKLSIHITAVLQYTGRRIAVEKIAAWQHNANPSNKRKRLHMKIL